MVIRDEQLKALEQSARRRFEDEMAAHGQAFSPRLCEVIGDEQLRVAVRSAIVRAEGFGFTRRGPIRLYVEMMFLCGSSFDNDPQYAPLGEVLRNPGDQMLRAQEIHEGHNAYLERVSGPKASNVHRALREILRLARAPLNISGGDLPAGLLAAMHEVFPEKAAYVGNAGLSALIDDGIAEARQYGLEGARPCALLVVLKFAFGHGCANDPLYPWIARTLADRRLAGPEALAARLEKKAITWLEHVVSRNERGAQS